MTSSPSCPSDSSGPSWEASGAAALCRELLDAAGIAMVVVDRDYRPRMVNETFRVEYQDNGGIQPAASLADFFAPELFARDIQPHLDQAFGGAMSRSDFSLHCPTRGHRLLRLVARPAVTEKDRVLGVIVSLHDITIQQQSLRVSKQARLRLKRILDGAPYGAYVVDREHRVVYVNAVLAKIFGPADKTNCQEYFGGRQEVCPWCRAGDPLCDKPLRWQWTDRNSGRIFDAFDIPVPHDDDLLKVGLLHDITEHEQMREELDRQRRLFDLVLNNTTAVIFVKDVAGRYLLVNARFRELFWPEGSDIHGKTDCDIFPPDEALRFQANDRQVLATREILQTQETFWLHDGLHTYISVRVPLCGSQGTVYAVAGISTDITALKQAEQALTEKHAEFLAMINGARDFILFKDGEGRWLLLNEAGRRMLRLEEVEYVGRTNEELLARYPELCEMFHACQRLDQEVWAKGRGGSSLERLRMADGEERVLEVAMEPQFHADGRRKGLMVLGRDVTARHRAEERFRSENLERLEALSQLENKTREIEAKNTALTVLLERHGQIQQQMEERLSAQLHSLVSPLLEQLEPLLQGRNSELLREIKAQLASQSGSFALSLNNPSLRLTDRERLVAGLIRRGRSNREIAFLLGLAERSIESYGNSLRRKLGLTGKRVRLRKFLQENFSGRE